MSNKLIQMAKEMLEIENDLPYHFDYSKHVKPTIDDFDICVFEQVRGSTDFGFGEIGGQAMQAVTTYVFVPISVEQDCFVYFGGRFAYAAPYSDKFMEDVKRGNMAPVNERGKYKIVGHICLE